MTYLYQNKYIIKNNIGNYTNIRKTHLFSILLYGKKIEFLCPIIDLVESKYKWPLSLFLKKEQFYLFFLCKLYDF